MVLVAGVLFFVGKVALGPTLSTADPWIQGSYAGLIWTLAAITGWRLSSIEPKQKLDRGCPKCGYPLDGLGSNKACPECGKARLPSESTNG